ncbi:MAG: hypothetical protein ACJ73N_11425, partial [Bryobacteraceae bacterium]
PTGPNYLSSPVNNANQKGHEIINAAEQQQISEHPQQEGPDTDTYIGRNHGGCGGIDHFALLNSAASDTLIAKF